MYGGYHVEGVGVDTIEPKRETTTCGTPRRRLALVDPDRLRLIAHGDSGQVLVRRRGGLGDRGVSRGRVLASDSLVHCPVSSMAHAVSSPVAVVVLAQTIVSVVLVLTVLTVSVHVFVEVVVVGTHEAPP